MRKILLSTLNPDEKRIAILSDGILLDYLSIVPGAEDRKNNIYCGIVHEIEPSLDACFVNIGDGKKGFLQFSEIDTSCLLDKEGSVAERLSVGMPILVQIAKDSRSDKGAFLTTRIKLFGHQLILLPRDKEPNLLRVSRHCNETDRTRIMTERDNIVLPDKMALIVRKQGTDQAISSINWELTHYLLPLWDMILKVFVKLSEPTLIYQDSNIVNMCIREYLTPSTSELIIDNPVTYEEAKETSSVLIPALQDKISLAPDADNIFDEQVLSQLDALIARGVKLPSGGEIVIDMTEALIAIDVNSKRFRTQSNVEQTALQTNLEAASEAARQLRLRNLAGLVVIDFIDMGEESNRQKLAHHIQREFNSDRASVNIDRISKFGTVTLSRQNIGRPLHESHSVICTNCQGTGRLPTVRSFARNVLDKLRDAAVKRSSIESIVLELPIDPAIYLLNENRDKLSDFEANFKCKLIILPRNNLQIPDYNLRIDKHSRKAKSSEDSFERKPIKGVEHGTYLNDPKSTRRQMPPAITSFKPSHRPKPATPAASHGHADVPKESSGGLTSWFKELLFQKKPAATPQHGTHRTQSKRSKSAKPKGKISAEQQAAEGSTNPKRRRRRSTSQRRGGKKTTSSENKSQVTVNAQPSKANQKQSAPVKKQMPEPHTSAQTSTKSALLETTRKRPGSRSNYGQGEAKTPMSKDNEHKPTSPSAPAVISSAPPSEGDKQPIKQPDKPVSHTLPPS